MDLHDFLQQFIALDMAHVLIVAAVVGGASFAVVKWVDTQDKNRGGVGLNPQYQFWGNAGLDFVIPLGAYIIDSVTQKNPVTFNGVFLALAVAFTASTAIHWITGGASKAMAIHNAKKAQVAAAATTNPPTPPATPTPPTVPPTT